MWKRGWTQEMKNPLTSLSGPPLTKVLQRRFPHLRKMSTRISVLWMTAALFTATPIIRSIFLNGLS